MDMVTEDKRWSYADQAAAGDEGWDLFLVVGATDDYHDPFELQRIDEMAVFDDPSKPEGGAWEHVLHRAFGGSPLHCKALAFLTATSPREILRILGVHCDANHYT